MEILNLNIFLFMVYGSELAGIYPILRNEEYQAEQNVQAGQK